MDEIQVFYNLFAIIMFPKVWQARLKSWMGPVWPQGRSLPLSDIEYSKKKKLLEGICISPAV